MKTVYLLGGDGIGWTGFVALLEKHRIDRVLDVRRGGELRGGFSFEPWANLGPFQKWERDVVNRDLRKLLDASDGARLALFDGGHLVRLLRDAGWRALRIEADGRLVEETGAKTPVVAVRRTAGATHSSQRF